MKDRRIAWRGEEHTLVEWARLLDIPYPTMYSRLKMGYELDRVFEKPKWYVVYRGEEIIANGHRMDVCRQTGWSRRQFVGFLARSKKGKCTYTIVELEDKDD